MKIPERLEPLVDQGIIQEVIQPLRSGKEAQVYIVVSDGEYCVAKVYKDAEHRSFRHRAGYTEGRRVRNSRERRAMEKGSKFGKEQMEAAWQSAEVDALYRLYDAGVRVPRPRIFSDGVLLMDIVLDPEGGPAPRLFDCDFTPEQATQLHELLIRQSVYMLCAGMVHGDLSECNVLLAWDGPMIIDFPQATDAAHNPNAQSLFLRDVANFTNFLARFEPSLAETKFGPEIWNLYERSELFPDSVLTGRWRGSDRKADTRAVLREVEAAAREARMKAQAEGRPTPKNDIPRDGLAEARDDRRGRGGSAENDGQRERPRPDRPRGDRPRDDRPRTDRPRGDRPRDDRPRTDRPRDDRPRDDRPRTDRPRDDRPPDRRPDPQRTTSAKPPASRSPRPVLDDLPDDLDALLSED
jgi:RIO kinase 1